MHPYNESTDRRGNRAGKGELSKKSSYTNPAENSIRVGGEKSIEVGVRERHEVINS